MPCAGVVLKNWKRLGIGLAGGFLGGLIGGLLFDPISFVTNSAVQSRFVAIVAIGVFAGLGTGLIETAAKAGWLRVVAGLIAGKQFIIYKNPTYIGSSPQCEIYLFKDPQVGPRHAAIHSIAGGYEIEDLQSPTSTFVNGRSIVRTRLRSGDQVQIGGTILQFQEKGKGYSIGNVMAGVTEDLFTFPCIRRQTPCKHDLGGRKGKCKRCGSLVTIPSPSINGRVALHHELNGDSQGGSIAVEEVCSICQNSIENGEPKIACSICGLPFHAECWRENLGCSAYGCSNVNILKTGPDIRIENLPAMPMGNLHHLPPVIIPPPLPNQRSNRCHPLGICAIGRQCFKRTYWIILLWYYHDLCRSTRSPLFS